LLTGRFKGGFVLYWIYIGIVVIITAIVIAELIDEPKIWNKIAYAMVLLPFILRILQIK